MLMHYAVRGVLDEAADPLLPNSGLNSHQLRFFTRRGGYYSFEYELVHHVIQIQQLTVRGDVHPSEHILHHHNSHWQPFKGFFQVLFELQPTANTRFGGKGFVRDGQAQCISRIFFLLGDSALSSTEGALRDSSLGPFATELGYVRLATYDGYSGASHGDVQTHHATFVGCVNTLGRVYHRDTG